MKAGSLGRLLAIALLCAGGAAGTQNVEITPLGSHAGELCDRYRATLFEDPSGVRILYDAGHSITGGDDRRLGDVHLVLLSHAHGDHTGDRKMKVLEAGSCALPETVSAAPNSTTGEIAAAKNAAIVMIVPTANFIGRKVDNIRGKPTVARPQANPDIVVPLKDPCLAGVQLGGARTFRTAGAARAVNEFLKPAAVIVSRVNEAATEGGKLRPNSRTAAFVELVKTRPVHLARSGRTMEFDGNATCVSGC